MGKEGEGTENGIEDDDKSNKGTLKRKSKEEKEKRKMIKEIEKFKKEMEKKEKEVEKREKAREKKESCQEKQEKEKQLKNERKLKEKEQNEKDQGTDTTKTEDNEETMQSRMAADKWKGKTAGKEGEEDPRIGTFNRLSALFRFSKLNRKTGKVEEDDNEEDADGNRKNKIARDPDAPPLPPKPSPDSAIMKNIGTRFDI